MRVAFAIGGLAVTSTCLIAAMVGVVTTQRLEASTAIKLHGMAGQLASELDSGIYERARDLRACASDDTFEASTATPAAKKAMLDVFAAEYPDYSWIGLLDTNGKIIADTGGIAAGMDEADLPAFKNARATTWMAGFSDSEKQRLLEQSWDGAQQPLFQIATPVHDFHGQFNGVLVAHVSRQWASHLRDALLDPWDAGHGYELLVVDSNGAAVVGPKPAGAVDPRNDVLRLDGRQYVSDSASADASQDLIGIGLTAIARQSRAKALQPGHEMQALILEIGGVLALIGIFLAWWISGRLTAPLIETAAAADAITEGDEISIPVVRGNDEMAHLSASLRKLVDGLQASEDRYRRLLDTSLEAIIHVDANERIDYVNPRLANMLGYKIEELVGMSPYDLMFEEDRRRARFRARLRDGQAEQHEIRLRHTTGREVWFVMCLSVVYKDGMYVGTFLMGTDITERRRAEEALGAAFDRQVLLTQIGEKLRQSTNAQEIQQTAVKALGDAVGADRCLFVLTSYPSDDILVEAQYVRSNLLPLPPRIPCSAKKEQFPMLFPDLHPVVISDKTTSDQAGPIMPLLDQFEIASAIIVPLFDGELLVAALAICMNQPRAWRPEEAQLIEAVATQIRSAVETSRVAHREHNIATVLQRALQPSAPEQVPHLDIATYYKAALDEASIGGDFFDLFKVHDGQYALIIADVSGKGLEAAVQVNSIRSMLRYVLYEGKCASDALASLNRIFSKHRLVNGFVTVFVGLYSPHSDEMEYASAGHEPVLLRKESTGSILELEATGPPLGVDYDCEYQCRLLELTAGDALLMYTDGLSEAGPERLQMIGTHGLSQLLAAHTSLETASRLKSRIVSRVEEFAGKGLRDDACMVTVVVQ